MVTVEIIRTIDFGGTDLTRSFRHAQRKLITGEAIVSGGQLIVDPLVAALFVPVKVRLRSAAAILSSVFAGNLLAEETRRMLLLSEPDCEHLELTQGTYF
jgi:hypothetical protein